MLQHYLNFVKGIIIKDYYYAISNAERVLAGNQGSKILSNNQASEVFKYIMLSLIKIGRPDLAKTVFDINLKQLNIENGSQEYVEILLLYFYALSEINKKK